MMKTSSDLPCLLTSLKVIEEIYWFQNALNLLCCVNTERETSWINCSLTHYLYAFQTILLQFFCIIYQHSLYLCSITMVCCVTLELKLLTTISLWHLHDSYSMTSVLQAKQFSQPSEMNHVREIIFGLMLNLWLCSITTKNEQFLIFIVVLFMEEKQNTNQISRKIQPSHSPESHKLGFCPCGT